MLQGFLGNTSLFHVSCSDTVDGRNPANHIDFGEYPYEGFMNNRWCRIAFINSFPM